MIPATNKDVSRSHSRSSSMRPPPPRFSLMTPSASPPVQRPFGRNHDGSSPTKRQRMMSETPASMSSGSSSGARSRSLGPSSFSLPSPALSIEHSIDHVEDLHSARRASSFKVLHVWSQLAEKYAKPLDQDDIVDLENETIIKDYGVLRSSNNVWDIGCFADDHEIERQQIASEDEPDELDAFAETASRSETDGEEDELEIARQQLRLPPVRELDPADAADLAEFMEAERRRKELFGDIDEESDRRSTASRSEVDFGEEDDEEEATQGEGDSQEEEEEEGEDYYEVYEDCEVGLRDEANGKQFRTEARDRSGSVLSGSPEIDFIDLSTADSDEDERGGDESEVNKDDFDFTSEQVEKIIREEDGDSDDELGGWEQDEGTVVYELADPEIVEIEDGDADAVHVIDSIEHTVTSTQNTVVEAGPSKRKPKKGTAATPRKTTQKAKVAGKKMRDSSSVSAIADPEPVQLNTPPRSSSYGPEVHKSRDMSSNSRQRRKKSPLKKALRIASPPASESAASELEDPITEVKKSGKRQSQTTSKADPVSSTRTSKTSPEVYIDMPPTKLKTASASTTSTLRRSGRDYLNSGSDGSHTELPITQKNWKGKEKEKILDFVRSGPPRKVPQDSPTTSSYAISSSRSSGDLGSRNATSSNVTHGTRKRRREPTPPHVMEVESEYISNQNATEDYEHQRSLSTSISPSPPPSKLPARGRVTQSRPNGHAFENEDRYVEHEAGPSSRSRQSSQPRRHNDSFTPDSPPRVVHSRSHSRSRSHYQSSSSDDTRTPRAEGRRREQSVSNVYQQPSSQAIPDLQAPEAQFQLAKIAQNLQNLTALLGGTLGNGLNPLSNLEDLTQSPWPSSSPRHPHTPRHYHHQQFSQTPQSAATAPPTSSPVGSDYSELPSSSPIKYSTRERGRSKSVVEQSSPRRPKSAMRDRSRSSRSRTIFRRVSFSSPEAVNIDDPYVRQSSDDKSDSDNNGSRYRRMYRDRYENAYSHSDDNMDLNRVTMRAQTPGPPGEYRDSQRALSRSRTVDDHDDRPRRPRTPSLHSTNRERSHYR